MTYEIQRNVAPAPVDPGGRPDKSAERLAMEQLEVGDAFMVTDASRVSAARSARPRLRPREFTVRKVAGQGWQVRRCK